MFKKMTALMLALLLCAVPALAEAQADAADKADAIFTPAIMSAMYNECIPLIFANAQGVDLDALTEAMTIQYLSTQDGALYYSTIDGRFSLLFEGEDAYATVPRLIAMTTYDEAAGREVPLYPFFFAVSSLSGDMDFFAWAMGEHEDALDLYSSEKFSASYAASEAGVTVQLSTVK